MLFRICAVLCNFYPRPPRGGRPVCFAAGRVSVSISIHALREEGDSSPIFKKVAILNFYPRPPRGGRRNIHGKFLKAGHISIHALREEGDVLVPLHGSTQSISIHALREEGDSRRHTFIVFVQISIHALREEGDLDPSAETVYRGQFLSTPSARRATADPRPQCPPDHNFYPRPPRGGRQAAQRSGLKGLLFLSTPSARRATTYLLLL